MARARAISGARWLHFVVYAAACGMRPRVGSADGRGGMLGRAAGARMLRRAARAHAWGVRVTGDACWGMLQAPARGVRDALMAGLLPQNKKKR